MGLLLEFECRQCEERQNRLQYAICHAQAKKRSSYAIPASNSPRHHFEPDCLLDDATVFNVAMLGNQNPDTSEVIGGNGNVIVKS